MNLTGEKIVENGKEWGGLRDTKWVKSIENVYKGDGENGERGTEHNAKD